MDTNRSNARTIRVGGVFAAVLMISLAAGAAYGQGGANLPATINVPVTFYDFRSDRSNPEFEQPHRGGRALGLVQNTLDADFKPVAGPNAGTGRAMGVHRWFRCWETDRTGPFARGDLTAPRYTPTPGLQQWHDSEWNATVVYQGVANVGHDTSFKNIVFRNEHLTFTLVDARTGMYEFSRREPNSFFPLDNRGFGNEWPAGTRDGGRNVPNRNFSFTMELAFQFDARRDMTFDFEGDDDVWVFIDRQLVLDIGGIHSPISDRFRVDQIPGVVIGNPYTLRIFYAERHSDGSNIWIRTNIIAPPGSMSISPTPPPNIGGVINGAVSIPADSSLTVHAIVYDDNGRVMDQSEYNCDHIVWRVDGREIGRGCSIEIADTVAGTKNITVTYTRPGEAPVTGNAGVNIMALWPASIHIQRDPAPKLDRPFSDDVFFAVGEERANVYAVLRDQYGNVARTVNFDGFADAKTAANAQDWGSNGTAAVWGSGEPTVYSVTMNGTRPSHMVVNNMFRGEGNAESVIFVSYRACNFTNTDCRTLVDTVTVGLRSTASIAIGPNPFVPGVSEIPSNVRDFYQNVINRNSGSVNGVLIAVDAPARLEPVPGTGSGLNASYARVVIYDAVGNIVRTAALSQSSGGSRSYGYIWDGKNSKGRTVGPGTYLVRVSGREAESRQSFFVQRMIGVTK